MHEIRTERLRWREPRASDVEGYMAFVSDYEVVKWTATWPHPADRGFVASRCVPFGASLGFGGPVFLGDEQIGGMGLKDGELGYFFARAHWGKGYATEIGRAIIARGFQNPALKRITASVIVGNPGSSRVLEKLGFVKSGMSRCYSVAQGGECDATDYVVSRGDWLAANPYVVRTRRLLIRGVTADDWGDLQSIAGVPQVARNMRNIGVPWSERAVQDWVEKSKWRGSLGFRPAVCLLDGTLIGALGLGGDPVTCAYFLGEQHWGKGYATEAMAAFLGDAYIRFGLDEVQASHFIDNPASGRVLRKLGFEDVGEDLGSSTARLEDATETLYRVSRNAFEAIT